MANWTHGWMDYARVEEDRNYVSSPYVSITTCFAIQQSVNKTPPENRFKLRAVANTVSVVQTEITMHALATRRSRA